MPLRKKFRIVEARSLAALFPGLVLCALIAAVSLSFQHVEERMLAHPYIDSLVIAILLGMTVRSIWTLPARWQPGIAFSAKQLLEVAVTLLGASISFAAITNSGPLLLSIVLFTVVVTLAASYGLSRLLGLPIRISILIACGNSICGNSAIAAVAPVIGAGGDDVASSISFTAILGVAMVLGLPFLLSLLDLSATQYGVLAGLTVYAVPQVLAATVPAGLVSTQIGTLVKLVRVLMLGPIVLGLGVVCARLRNGTGGGRRIHPMKLVPWFIVGFLLLATLRSFHIIPDTLSALSIEIARMFAVVAMAALGLHVDMRVLTKVGGKVTGAVTLSLLMLLMMSVGLVQLIK